MTFTLVDSPEDFVHLVPEGATLIKDTPEYSAWYDEEARYDEEAWYDVKTASIWVAMKTTDARVNGRVMVDVLNELICYLGHVSRGVMHMYDYDFSSGDVSFDQLNSELAKYESDFGTCDFRTHKKREYKRIPTLAEFIMASEAVVTVDSLAEFMDMMPEGATLIKDTPEYSAWYARTENGEYAPSLWIATKIADADIDYFCQVINEAGHEMVKYDPEIRVNPDIHVFDGYVAPDVDLAVNDPAPSI